MVIKYYVDRHSLYHSCYPSSVSCKTYRRITVMFFSTIVMMQFHLFTIIYTKNAPRKALAFDLILLLISLGILPCLTSLVRSAKSTDSSKVHTVSSTSIRKQRENWSIFQRFLIISDNQSTDWRSTNDWSIGQSTKLVLLCLSTWDN